jgi:hypothetical protein
MVGGIGERVEVALCCWCLSNESLLGLLEAEETTAAAAVAASHGSVYCLVNSHNAL